MYPFIVLGLYLSLTDRAGPWYWVLLSGPGAVFLAVIRLGPTAVEPPGDIIEEYSDPLVGWMAFTWLLGLIAVLIVMFLYEARMSWGRRGSHGTSHQIA